MYMNFASMIMSSSQMERLAMARMGFLDKAREVEVSRVVYTLTVKLGGQEGGGWTHEQMLSGIINQTTHTGCCERSR